MTVTPPDLLKGLLPAVISGGRPALRQRHTYQLLRDLHGVTADPVWVVMDEHAAGYERDGHEIVSYSREWAEPYARAHWTGMKALEPGGFVGAFPGREWACLLAEERGCWGVLQLDDNIHTLSVISGYAYAVRVAAEHGGLAMFADVLAAVTQSTNGRMTGAFLRSVNPNYKFTTARVGFPYSLFIERVGDGREHWYGPYEDDITHAYQYGTRGAPGTSVVVPVLNYGKDSAGGGGMRVKGGYDNMRSVALQRLFPESAKLIVRATRSNGKGDARVFHYMSSKAIRNPITVTNRELFDATTAYLEELGRELAAAQRADLKQKVATRAARYRSRTAEPPAT